MKKASEALQALPPRRRTSALPVAGIILASALALATIYAQPASATPSECPTQAATHITSDWFNSGHQGVFRAQGWRCNNGLEYWENFRTYEASPWWDTVCNTQSYLNGNTPSQGTIFSQYSSHMSGCTLFFKLYDWPNWESYYPPEIYFGGWWFSDSTPGAGWHEIGILQR